MHEGREKREWQHEALWPRLKAKKAEEIQHQVQSCRLLHAGWEEEEAEEAVTHGCSQGLLRWWLVSMCTLGDQAWWPHFSHVWCTSDVGQSQKTARGERPGARWGPGARSAVAPSSLLLCPGQTMASLRSARGFSSPLSMWPLQHEARWGSCPPWGWEEEEKVWTAPVGVWENRECLWYWEVWGQGMGQAVQGCPWERPRATERWRDLTGLCGGKAGKAAACTATFGVTYQVRCFWMGKTNGWTWLCSERYVWPSVSLITFLFSCRI